MKIFNTALLILISCISLSCSSGGGADGGPGTDGDCDGTCANQNLLAEDVERILSQAITSAKLQGINATISVLDRVGNVLAIYQMPGSNLESLITGQIGAVGGLEGLRVPASLVSISKAGTGAYLSSQGNAFSSRTAGHIVQEHFNPGEIGQVAGPLFGVQFSQLICSDVTKLDASMGGPRALPLGLSADPGGFPLYKSGDLVGGIGVEVDGVYTFDRNIFDVDANLEERIALEGSSGFHAPEGRKADKIFVGGKSLRYSDVDTSLASDIVLEVVDRSNLLKVPPFTDGSIKAGTIFTSLSSGVIRTSRAGLTTEVLVNSDGGFRYPSTDGGALSGSELKVSEVEALLNSAVLTSSRARAAIRRPLDTSARVSVWIVDHLGVPLGFARTMDAPVFGIDVALQKARTAAFFSSNRVRDVLVKAGFSDYLNRSKVLLGENVFSGENAFSNRAIGNISRPFFPDGIRENFPGTFSLPFSGATYATGSNSTWSPFNTGLQLDLIKDAVLAPLSGVIPSQCTSQAYSRSIANGIQIFPGSVPLYRGTTLIGAIGVSGDGIDQDDLVAFYSASRQGLESVGQSLGDIDLGFNAPKELRSDKIPVNYENLRLRYVNCPEAPFAGSSEQGVCDGL